MKDVVIFDNRGKTFDRYTIIMPNGDIYGASKNPYHPQGFGMFSHSISEIGGYINEAKANPEWLGIEIQFEELPDKVQEFIEERC